MYTFPKAKDYSPSPTATLKPIFSGGRAKT